MQENKRGNILLESGTNEIEIMQFTVDDNLYGINVAKVREIMMSVPVKAMPHAHPAVEGIFLSLIHIWDIYREITISDKQNRDWK